MHFSEFRFLVRSDLYRHTGKASIPIFLRTIILIPEFRFTFWLRLCAYLRQHAIFRYGFYHLSKIILRHYIFKYGIAIPCTTQIGSGFYIGHCGGIVVNGKSVIGKNCNISHCVTLGQANRGKKRGYPIIGDNVYIGPGAKIVGNVRVGNDVAIGANCVVTKDVPDNAVVVGVPGKVISYQGSQGYVEMTDY